MLDRIDADIDRLHRINLILEAGVRRFGPTFVEEINKELGDKGRLHQLKRLRVVHIRASRDIGAMAAEYAKSPEFAGRASGMIGKIVRRISEWEGAGEADLLSYILFDGEFSARLIELGRNDARARHDELCAFFEELTPKDKDSPAKDKDAKEKRARAAAEGEEEAAGGPRGARVMPQAEHRKVVMLGPKDHCQSGGQRGSFVKSPTLP